MKNIFIIGSRGYQTNYGGWETFVTNFVDHYHDSDTTLYVGELTEDPKADKQFKKMDDHLYRMPIYVKIKGSSKMFFYTMKSYLATLKYIKKEKIKNPYIYVLGLKLGPLLWFHKRLRKKQNIKIFVNPDGLEHLRSKWNKIVQFCFLLSEQSMIRHCDLVVCDGLGIQKYIKKKYPKAKTTYIAYGSNQYDFTKIKEEPILKKYHLKKDDYCLIVGRSVPENNYELIINDFMKSNIKKKLVIITNLSSSSYYQELIQKTNCLHDSRITFIDGVYDPIQLAVIRKNAYLYIHGHSVGGTNPSLIEALSLTDLNILYDVCFNHDIGLETTLYFKEPGSLKDLLDRPSLLEKNKKKLGELAKKRVKDHFTWEHIMDLYKKIFDED